MDQIPHALLKDLLSTGYFFGALKNYSGAAEIDLPSYNRDFTLPYLIDTAKSYERSGQLNRSKIVREAVERLSGAGDDELADSILELRKIADSAIDANERELLQNEALDKSAQLSCRHKSESARSLSKLLVSIIKTFKLS
jgi:hypothetical protein